MTKQEGRPFDEDVLIDQIGRMNVFAISGGRVGVTKNNQGETVEIELPVGYGYRVSITLGWDDTYTVSRVIVKNTKKGISEVIKGTVEGVYCENIGEVAYQASCFRSNDAFGKAVA